MHLDIYTNIRLADLFRKCCNQLLNNHESRKVCNMTRRLIGRPFYTGLAVSAWMGWTGASAHAQFTYTTLDYGTSGTFLTGIRGNNIVGNYVIPGSGQTGGLLYNLSTKTWTPFPLTTANGANYPGAIGSSPYGPGFGSQSGILNVVGSYKTQASSPYNLSYLYDGSLAPGGSLTTLAYPGTSAAPTLETIAHSTFGNQVVGNYDTRLATGNAFIYTINTGAYTTNNFPSPSGGSVVSTTAYGVWGDKIAGGYTPPGTGFERGYIYDETTGVWTTYNHPGAVFTHFEGITSAGRANTYNLVADWGGPDGAVHASVLHLAADGTQTWIELGVGTALTSANSIYENQAIGIYVDSNGLTHGYLVSIPGIYDPIRNAGVLTGSTPNTPALAGGDGDDVVNDGVIRTLAPNSSGIRSGTYGVVTNNGSITVTGAGSAGVEMSGAYGTLLNPGSIIAAPGADAIRTDPSAFGTAIVNDGTIDGRIAVTPATNDARFENSGWLGISAPGSGVTHLINGIFGQTSTGTLTLRIGSTSNDALQVTGAALLAGTLAPTVGSGISQPIGTQYQIITAQGGIGGSFATLTQPAGLPPGTRFDALYAPTTLNLVITPSSYGNLALAGIAETANQRAIGNALDAARPAAGVAMTAAQGPLYARLYTLSDATITQALDQLAPTIYGDALMVGRDNWFLVAGAISEQLAARRGARTPGTAETTYGPLGSTIWLTGLGQFGNVNSNSTPGYSSTTGGVATGIDLPLNSALSVGAAFGFTHQSISAKNAASFTGDALQFELYGSLRQGAAFLDVQAGGAFYEGTATRPLFAGAVQAKGDTNGAAGGGSLRAGVRLEAAAWQIEPSLSLGGVSLSQGSLTETAAGPVGLALDGASVGSLQTLLGVRAERRFMLSETVAVVPSAQIGWLHEYLDTQGTVTASFIGAPGVPFGISSASVGRDAAVIGVHADLDLSGPISVYAGYAGALYDSSAVQTVSAGLRFVW